MVHATFPANGSAASLNSSPDFVSFNSCVSLSPGKKTKLLAVLESLAKNMQFKFRPVQFLGALRQLNPGDGRAISNQQDHRQRTGVHVLPPAGITNTGLVINPEARWWVNRASRGPFVH